MQPKSPKWLHDLRTSADFILQLTAGKTLADYVADPVVHAAVERHFEIIGEAMKRLAQHDPETAAAIGDYPRIIAFRNLLIHGYELVEHDQVWQVIQEHLPKLQKQVETLLRNLQEG
ncbi:MAG TPA: HepT-like ribonuclease domain-containing protein [Armatimonadota bacterium]|jgi:uncharacterized protein with HEPN domain